MDLLIGFILLSIVTLVVYIVYLHTKIDTLGKRQDELFNSLKGYAYYAGKKMGELEVKVLHRPTAYKNPKSEEGLHDWIRTSYEGKRDELTKLPRNEYTDIPV